MTLNPLYVIFEKHLYDLSNSQESEEEFIDKIIQDYLEFLAHQQVTVPKKFESHIIEELKDQVKQMMVKKTYGCLSKEEFLENTENFKVKKKTAKKKYSKLF